MHWQTVPSLFQCVSGYGELGGGLSQGRQAGSVVPLTLKSLVSFPCLKHGIVYFFYFIGTVFKLSQCCSTLLEWLNPDILSRFLALNSKYLSG